MKILSNMKSLMSPAVMSNDWHATEPWVRFGNRVVVVYLCGGLLLASVLFSISGAVVTSGTVAVEGDYQSVQHLEGGIISKILAHNGDRVKQGDVLVQMEDNRRILLHAQDVISVIRRGNQPDPNDDDPTEDRNE